MALSIAIEGQAKMCVEEKEGIECGTLEVNVISHQSHDSETSIVVVVANII